MTSPWIFKLGAPLNGHNVTTLGGKGSQLAELAVMRYKVPPGFVIKASAFKYLWDFNLTLMRRCEDLVGKVTSAAPDVLEAVAREIKVIIGLCKFPEDLAANIQDGAALLKSNALAVRSSASAEDSHAQSYAGMFDTYLNVSQDDLLCNVINCWGSQFAARSLAYRMQQGNYQPASLDFAVVVQSMVASEISGATFTRCPNSPDPDCMLIEAVWGLGEALVGGEVSPDSYMVCKSNGSLTHSTLQPQLRMQVPGYHQGTQWVPVSPHRAKQRKLDDYVLHEMTLLCSDLERTFGYPCDIEWAITGKAIYVVQCRPITVNGGSLNEPST